MAFFESKVCAICGEKTSLLTRLRLADGNYLCSTHKKVIPDFMRDSVSGRYSLEDYQSLISYIEYSNRYLRSKFVETSSYYTLHIDHPHKLFYIGHSIDTKTVFFSFHNVENFDLLFVAEEIKEGMLGDKVIGEIILQLEVNEPYFYFQDKLDTSAKAKAKKKVFGNKISYDNPSGMDEFEALFRHTWKTALEEYVAEQESAYERTAQTSVAPSELQSAMALFMIDSIEKISIEDVRNIRNRLIKTFHPDKSSADDTQYAQRINNAYETLKHYIEQGR